jgi:LuxR family transcriptional regulator of csgAB operon
MSARHDTAVFLLAAANFHTDALAAAIAREVGGECVCCGDSTEVHEKANACTARARLLLIDGSTRDFESALVDNEVRQRGSADGLIPVLYNLQAGSGIERKAFARGVRGFFYSHDTLDHLVKGLRALLNGELWMSRDLLVEFALRGSAGGQGSDGAGSPLTRRETQILALVSSGASNEEIAEKLGLSQHTVKTHLHNVFRKISVPNRFQAALWAAKHL